MRSRIVRGSLLSGLSLLAARHSRSADSHPSLDTRIQQAGLLSKQGGKNITAAFQAVEQWSDIILSNQQSQLTPHVASLVHRLFGSSLVRIGRDADALKQYDEALTATSRRSEIAEINLNQARCWQRLMKYRRALSSFVAAGAYLEAAVCYMRLGDVNGAIEALGSVECGDGNVILSLMRGLLTPAVQSGERSIWRRGNAFSSMQRQALTNNGAFDDPLLIHLDDKVHLHNLLSNSNETAFFWPEGKVIINSSELQFRPAGKKSVWILKSRSGYGSHGNQLVEDIDETMLGSDDGDLLLQRMVEPPYLLDGRKFSLRVYVVRVGRSSYVSTDVLVKIAQENWIDGGMKSSQHMTNSGRSESMAQGSFRSLQETMTDDENTEFWIKIRDSAKRVLDVYDRAADNGRIVVPESSVPKDEVHRLRQCLSELCHPKVLGFDFVVDAQRNPWLIEVNRFPGLEPRDLVDTPIKQRVVSEAWALAQRQNVSSSFGNLQPL